MKYLFCVLLIVAASSRAAFSASLTAAELQKNCANHAVITQSLCVGYLRGFTDGVFGAESTKTMRFEIAMRNYERLVGCLPTEVNFEQMILVFLKYADNHPEELHLLAGIVLSHAWVAAFPCGTDKGVPR